MVRTSANCHLELNLQTSSEPLVYVQFTSCVYRSCVKCVRIWSFSGPNVGKYMPEKLRIRTRFTQWQLCYVWPFSGHQALMG